MPVVNVREAVVVNALQSFISGSRARRLASVAWLAMLLLATALPAGTAMAHAGEPPAPHDLLTAWNWDPAILIGLLLTAGLYGRGLNRVWRQAGPGRGVSKAQAAAFTGGILALFLALVSPLDPVGEALFSAHMVQHLVLVLVAAPLLMFGAPQVALAWALPRRARRSLQPWWRRRVGLRTAWRILSSAGVSWSLFALVLWLWHLPVLYQAALRSELIHAAEHLSFLGAALLFWWCIAQYVHGSRPRYPLGAGLLFVFTTTLHSTLLGALLTFSPQPWYPDYSSTVPAWGLTPLQDQQFAGVIMWVPMGIVYLAALLAILGRWLLKAEAAESRRVKAGWTSTSTTDRPVLDP